MNELEVFTAALELADPAARESFLEEACGGCPELRARLNALIRNAGDASRYLESPPGNMQDTLDELIADRVGTQIGPYKLLEQIGEGGMGVVYMAQQSEPLKRRVALKLIKPGMDTRQVIARFEAERQALAMMDHPHIARVLDAGATEAGRPYFVMELVHGIPITEYCDREQLDTRQRLELLIDVCRAVQHAHQKAIIHRDLKPSNVLVTLHDGEAVVKVIDFGVAKALDQELTERTLFTQFSQMVGTPLYMSPEQAAANAVDVDTRSDIYSLGVLLYELLTGTTPFDRNLLKNAGFDELRRIIREDDPPRPSARISTLHAAGQSTMSSSRNGDPRKLSDLLRGELDWIVMKSLEKDRNRRYETANALAADIQRYVDDESVQACPPSAGYRFRKYARRNMAKLTTAAIVAAALIIGTAVSVWQAVEANRARKVADERLVLANDRLTGEQQARREADGERNRANLERQRADVERQKAEANFQKALEAVDRMLTRVADESLLGVPQLEQVRKKVLQDAVEFYEVFLAERSGDPKLRYEIAKAYMRMVEEYMLSQQNEELQNALTFANQLFRELHAQQPDDEQIQFDLAYSYIRLGWISRPGSTTAETHFRDANELLIPLVEHQSGGARSDEYYGTLAKSCVSLAHALRIQHRFDEIEPMLDKVLALNAGRDDYYVLSRVSESRALLREEQGRLPEAIEAMQQSNREMRKLIDDPQKPTTLRQLEYAKSCESLGSMLLRAGRPAEAVPHYQQAIEIRERVAKDFPSLPRHKHFLELSRAALARIYQELGQPADTQQIIGQPAARTGEDYVASAELFEAARDMQSAIADYSKAIELEPSNANAYERRAALFAGENQYDQALADWAKAIELDPDNANNYFRRGQLLQRMKDYAIALGDYEEAITRNPTAWNWYKYRATTHFHLGHFNQALADLVQAHELKPDSNPNDFTTVTSIAPSDVAACPDERFRLGILALAERTIEDRQGDSKAFAYEMRGKLHQAMGHFPDALADFAQSLALAPEIASLHNNVAWFLATCPDPNSRNPAKAVELAQRAVKLDAASTVAWNTLGVALYRAGDWPAANETLAKSVEIRQGGDSFDWFFLTMAHWQLGNKEEARTWYDQAVEWMEKNKPEDEDLIRFRAEAQELLHVEQPMTSEDN